MEALRLSIKGIGGFVFACISFFISLPLIVLLFPFFQWLCDGYFAYSEMEEVIISIYKDIFDMLSFGEIRRYLK